MQSPHRPGPQSSHARADDGLAISPQTPGAGTMQEAVIELPSATRLHRHVQHLLPELADRSRHLSVSVALRWRPPI
eukprot:3427887-Heterocapsa_arctica.AAC.1